MPLGPGDSLRWNGGHRGSEPALGTGLGAWGVCVCAAHPLLVVPGLGEGSWFGMLIRMAKALEQRGQDEDLQTESV